MGLAFLSDSTCPGRDILLRLSLVMLREVHSFSDVWKYVSYRNNTLLLSESETPFTTYCFASCGSPSLLSDGQLPMNE